MRAARRGVVGGALIACLALAGTASGGLPTGDGRGGFELRRLASFDRPTYVHGPAGAGNVVFVVERTGRVRIMRRGEKRGTFLDIRGRVSCCSGERGLFSIAFRNYARSPFVFAYYTDNGGDIHIARFRFRREPLRARPRTHRRVLDIPHPDFDNHYGGQLQFGPDGRLYLATGDSGGVGDQYEKAQDRGSLLGKLLRIAPRRRGNRLYAIPRDNPYVGRPGRDEIYSRGLRNPWRFAFDRGRIVIADVGQARREEVDYERLSRTSGANFGWDNFEGTLVYEGGALARHDRPIHEYSHAGGRCSITGGYVVRARNLPSLYGRYLYGDLCTGMIRSLIPRLAGARDDKSTGLDPKPGLSTFGVDDRRRVYLASISSGRVFRIAPR